MRKNIFIFLILFSPFPVFANFDFNANCLKAYQHIFELKLGTARQLIANERKVHPNNSIIPLLENYVDYFYILTSDNKSEFERLEANKSKRLEQISDDDRNSPYYLYAQAEINLQWALIRGRYGSYYTAAREINRANNLLAENAKKFPAFHLNAKGLGLINVVMGSLPDGFLKSTLATFGIKGNVQVGLAMLDKLAENLPKSAYEPFFEDVVFNYVNILNDVVHSPAAY
ncbi:MAG: tetratricopeptide repeat protein, partial [Bacteroidia bacterium]